MLSTVQSRREAGHTDLSLKWLNLAGRQGGGVGSVMYSGSRPGSSGLWTSGGSPWSAASYAQRAKYLEKRFQ